MSEEKVASREEKLAPVIVKAWQDEAYKKELIANPKAVLQKEFGVELPDSLTIEVLEESPSKLYITIPPKPTGELTDEQLDAVAGGECVVTTLVVAGLLLGSAAVIGTVGGALFGIGCEQGRRAGW